MGLLASWRESLDILRPKNLKQFMLLTMNAWLQAWKAGWLFISLLLFGGLFGLDVLRYFAGNLFYLESNSFYYWFGVLVRVSLITLFLISSRPSIRLKESSYFLAMIRDFLLPILAMYVILTYTLSSLLLFNAGSGPEGFLVLVRVVLFDILFFNFMLFFLFFELFYLDARPWNIAALFASLRNGVVFLWYNLSLIWGGLLLQGIITGLIALLMYLLYSVFADLLRSMAHQYPTLINFLVFVIGYVFSTLFLTFWVNVYIKRVRDNPSLYV